MNCKDCAREKKCPNKKKPPAKCERFLAYDETAKFAAYDRMMRSNKGIDLGEAEESFGGLRGSPAARKYQAQAFYEGWDKRK